MDVVSGGGVAIDGGAHMDGVAHLRGGVRGAIALHDCLVIDDVRRGVAIGALDGDRGGAHRGDLTGLGANRHEVAIGILDHALAMQHVTTGATHVTARTTHVTGSMLTLTALTRSMLTGSTLTRSMLTLTAPTGAVAARATIAGRLLGTRCARPGLLLLTVAAGVVGGQGHGCSGHSACCQGGGGDDAGNA